MFKNPGFRLNGLQTADRAGNHMCKRMILRLLRRNQSIGDHLADQRMVTGQTLRFPVPDTVNTAVSRMNGDHAFPDEQNSRIRSRGSCTSA